MKRVAPCLIPQAAGLLLACYTGEAGDLNYRDHSFV
jgi:hypothetical protein